MLLAVPEFHGRVAPTFDFCHRVTLWRVDERGVRSAGQRTCRGLGPSERAPKLQAMGVDVLLCGAIGKDMEEDIRSRGVDVVQGLTGEVMEVISAYRCGALGEPRFKLPGVDGHAGPCAPGGVR